MDTGQRPRVRTALGVSARDVTGHSPGASSTDVHAPPASRAQGPCGRGMWRDTRGSAVVAHGHQPPEPLLAPDPLSGRTPAPPRPSEAHVITSAAGTGPPLAQDVHQLGIKQGSAVVRVNSTRAPVGPGRPDSLGRVPARIGVSRSETLCDPPGDGRPCSAAGKALREHCSVSVEPGQTQLLGDTGPRAGSAWVLPPTVAKRPQCSWDVPSRLRGQPSRATRLSCLDLSGGPRGTVGPPSSSTGSLDACHVSGPGEGP